MLWHVFWDEGPWDVPWGMVLALSLLRMLVPILPETIWRHWHQQWSLSWATYRKLNGWYDTYRDDFNASIYLRSHTERSSKSAYPSGPISTLNVFPQWWSAALVALYEAILKTSRQSSVGYLQRTGLPPATSAAHLHPYIYGTVPPTEPILTIAPFALISKGWNAWTIRMGPKTLTLNIFWTSRISVSMPVIV